MYDSIVISSDVYVTPHVCTSPIGRADNSNDVLMSGVDDMEVCVLRYLATSSTDSPAVKPNSYIMLLTAVMKFPSMFHEVQEWEKRTAREKFTTDKFCECVINNLIRTKRGMKALSDEDERPHEKQINEMRPVVADVVIGERVHGLWNQRQASLKTGRSHYVFGMKTMDLVCSR